MRAYLGVAAGNATQAARLAGYKSPKQQGSRLLTFGDVRAEIERQSRKKPRVMGPEELREWWTGLVSGEMEAEMRDRIKASELLGKSAAMFVKKVEHSGDRARLEIYIPKNGSEVDG